MSESLIIEECGCRLRPVTATTGELTMDQVHVCAEHALERARIHLAEAREVLEAAKAGRS